MSEVASLRIRTLDLFCGGGGSSWGAFHAGAEIVMGIDGWDRAINTYSLNFNGAGKHLLMTPETVPADLGLVRGSIDLLLASPECTNHTCAKGKRPRNEDSKRTANYVLNFARDLDPKWIVIENVIHMKRWEGYEPLLNELKALGYEFTVQPLNSAHFGVPQTRRRIFILCSKGQTPGLVPLPNNQAPTALEILDYNPITKLDLHTSRPFFTDRRAEPTKQRFQRGIETLGEGVPFLIVYYGSDAAGGWQALDRPLRTITTLDRFGLVTWRDKLPYFRMLQVPELMRAMGYDADDNYIFTGSRRERIKQIGNGVCPPVMEAIVKHLTRRKATGDGFLPAFHRNIPAATGNGI
jgi:DNA (cytosine-5)-methyltransferase 1